jgi:hypothetical protein
MCKRLLWLLLVVLALPAAQPAGAAGASDLLEKAIYAEETQGNLDEAIKLYSQVLERFKESRAEAAQATFRLAMCRKKKGQEAEASALFRQLIADFPQEKELVAKARQQLPPEFELEAAPWKNGETEQLAIRLPGGLEIGSFAWSVQEAELEGQKVWEFTTRRFVSVGGNNQGVSHVWAEPKTFAPLKSVFEHTVLGTTTAVYADGKVQVESNVGGKQQKRTADLQGQVYDNEEAVFVMRCLPLAEGFKATLNIYASFSSGLIPIEITVKAKEKVKVPAGEFECWPVSMSIGQDFWFTADEHRYLVKFSAEGVLGELTSILDLPPGEPVKLQDEKLGVAAEAPAGWLFYSYTPPNKPGVLVLFVLDPDADTQTSFQIKSPSPDERQKPLRTWAEEAAEKAKGVWKNYRVRDDSWKDRRIGDQQAVTYLADYQDASGKPMVEIAAFLMGPKRGAVFTARLAADSFEKLGQPLEQVLSSFRGG